MTEVLLPSSWNDRPDLDAARLERSRLNMARPRMELRARCMEAIRQFFKDEDFLEVFTPVRIPTPALEDYIEAVPSGKAWLRTSPEFAMKRMLAAGYERIYQTGSCFRREEFGVRHLTEFTMLEWYRIGADWLRVLADTQKLLERAAIACLGKTNVRFHGTEVDFGKEWELLTVEDAFRRYADADLDECIASGEFELILCEKVEPNLGMNGRPTALTGYPLACSGLSRQSPGRPQRVERWEVYVAGIELGNACSELAEPVEQERRFRECALLRQREGRDIYALDQPFLDAIRVGMPACAGVAIGLDRLFMLLSDAPDIASVNAFVE